MERWLQRPRVWEDRAQPISRVNAGDNTAAHLKLRARTRSFVINCISMVAAATHDFGHELRGGMKRRFFRVVCVSKRLEGSFE